MAITLIAPPGLSDLPDSALNAEEIAQGQHAVKILENTKFGVVRPEFFYMGRFSDGQTVARPTSKVDNLPYLASEVIYLWEIVLTSDPRDGISSGPGTILYFDYDVEQKDDGSPGLVHCKTVYHVQGGQTTETQDGELSVWAVGVRGLDQLSLAAIPAWTNVPETDFDLDSAWREDRLKDLNAAAKRSVVQAEFFDLGEFGNGQTVPQPVSDVDGFTYPYADLVFLTSWRWTPAFATGLSSGPSGHTLARLEKSVNGTTGLVDTTVTYRLGASSDTVTQDGRIHVFAFGFRAGITATGTVSFTDQNANVFLPGKPPLDDDTLVMVRNSKFAALRPEFFVTTQAHGTTVPLPTSPIDGYAYIRAELIYLYERSDTAVPGSIGSLLGLHGFIRQDTGVTTLNTAYYRQGGAQTNTNNGTFRVVTVALRSKDVEVDSDTGGPTGTEPGFEGGVDNDLVSGGGIVLMRNPDFESGDKNWTKGPGFTIEEDAANAYDGDWVGKFIGSADAALRNSVAIPCSPGNIVLGHCFIKRVSGDGTPNVRISWRDVSKNEFATTGGGGITSSTYALSRVVGIAPAGTFFAVVECTAGAPSVSQTAYYDQFHAAFFPIDLDDVGDSADRFARTAAHSSYRPLSNALTATDAGVNATVNIAAHTMRFYQNPPNDVSNNAGNVFTLTFDTLYFIYYQDDDLSGGAQTYLATTTRETASGLYVGSIRTPLNGGSDTIGNNDGGAGAQIGGLFIFYAVLFSAGSAWANPGNAADTKTSTLSAGSKSGAGGIQTIIVDDFLGMTLPWKRLELKIRTQVKNMSGAAPIAKVDVELAGGTTFGTSIYSTSANRALQVDTLVLAQSQRLNDVRVQAALITDTGEQADMDFYEAWIEGEL
ncbi:hypothetical protein LCGC14_1339600 [marine sediment metagenome]|uniref:Tip attachment protein J domain-containing protein n=1 Tax=marine sediment metagenome TaxID=412755 RepID=A0A0F9MV03_9ZZZZ